MSTSALITVQSRWDITESWNTHALIYVHHNGYLKGIGEFLCRYLSGLHVVNGILEMMPAKSINGPGELAAELVGQLYLGRDQPDLCPVNGRNTEAEYEYILRFKYDDESWQVEICVKHVQSLTLLFVGTTGEFRVFLGEQRKRHTRHYDP